MSDLFSLKNRIALVTGASRGLGRDMALCLAEAGATVLCAGRVAKDLETTVRLIKKKKGKAHAVILDVTNEQAVQKGVRALIRKHRRIDILVNNAGVIHRAPIVDTETKDYRKVIETDLIGPFALAREVGRSNRGTIAYLPFSAIGGLTAEDGDLLIELALQSRRPVAPLTEREPAITVDDAYQIQLRMIQRRLDAGETVVGKKIGVTSQVVMDMLGVNQPDFGHLLSGMVFNEGEPVRVSSLIAPRAEAEVAFILGCDLTGPGVTLAASDQVWADPTLPTERGYLNAVATGFHADQAGLFFIDIRIKNPHRV